MEITAQTITPYLIDLVKWYEKNGVEVRPLPKVILSRDNQNAKNPLGHTGYYDYRVPLIVLFTSDRHIKDVLRSFCHELIHHNQYLIYGDIETGTENVSKSSHLEQLEGDAYFRGNMLFRSWSDQVKNVR
jgi:hypothetical protein